MLTEYNHLSNTELIALVRRTDGLNVDPLVEELLNRVPENDVRPERLSKMPPPPKGLYREID